MTKKVKRIGKWLLAILLAPFALVLLLALLLYIPPIQNFVVDRVAESLSKSLQMQIRVDNVRLAFPLDLEVNGVSACDAEGDTLLAVKQLQLDVPLRPLFSGRVDVDGFALREAYVNTKSLVDDTYLHGTVGEMTASLHGVEWQTERVLLDDALLRNANLDIALSDTARQDTTTTPSKWHITTRRVVVENSSVRLSLPGDSMRLHVGMGRAELLDGTFDTGRGDYAIRSFNIKKGHLRYATRATEWLPPRGNTAYSLCPPLPWDTLTPPPTGVDPTRIDVTDLHLQIDTLRYTADGVLSLGLRELGFAEHCGLQLREGSGRVWMDSTCLRLHGLHLATAHSRMEADVDFPFTSLDEGSAATCRATLTATIGAGDVRMAAHGWLPQSLLRPLPDSDLTLTASLSGNAEAMRLNLLQARWPGILSMDADGTIDRLWRNDRAAKLNFDLRMHRFAPVAALLPREITSTVHIPANTRLWGTAEMNGDAYAARLDATARAGRMRLTAAAHTKAETYRLQLTAKGFPVGDFLPGMGLGALTGEVSADGRGFDPLAPTARMNGTARVDQLRCGEWQLGSLSLQAGLAGGEGTATFNADNEILKGAGGLRATLGKTLTVDMDGRFREINLQKLAGMEDTLLLGTRLQLHAYTDRALTDYGVSGGLTGIYFITKDRGIPAKDLNFAFATNPDTTTLFTSAGDLFLNLGAAGNLDAVQKGLTTLTDELTAQLARKSLDHTRLKAALPDLTLTLNAGNDNPVGKILHYKGYTFSSCRATLRTNAETGLNGALRMGSLCSGSLLLDTLDLVMRQDTAGVRMDARVKNFTKRNPTKFEALLTAYLDHEGAGTHLQFIDSEGQTGIDLGLKAEMPEGGLQLSLSPHNPVIAYRHFTVNGDNYLFLGRDSTITADIDLLADDGTALSIYSQPNPTANDLTLSLAHVNLKELSEVLPYLPPMSGMLSGDFHLIDDHQSLSAMATVDTRDLTYDGALLGNVGLEAIYMPKEGGEHHFNAFVSAEEEEVMALEGVYYDRDEGYFDGKANLMALPLRMLNGFLVGTDIALSGDAVGELSIRGSLDRPQLAGTLQFDTAHVYSDVYGFDFTLDPEPVRLEDGKMQLTDFRLLSQQSRNPLLLNGTINVADLSNIGLNLNMRASDFELINTKRKMQSLIYGKVYADFVGTIKGTLNDMSVRGKLDVLDRTDMTYILKDSPLTVDDRLHDLVQFVSFEDSTVVIEESEVPSNFDLTLGISVSNAAHFHCDLSEDGNNYVDIEGGGDLTLRMTPQGEMRLTGRFTMENGEMKYSLPIIPLKTFKLAQGSYVEFTGDMMNPTLNIAATERVKATVTENDQPRSVAFDVGVSITQPLESMGLEFTIEAPEDLAMQNKLAGMTRAQRGKSAVAMLATGMFLDDESLTSGGSGFKAGNALTAFLQSEIQNIAGNALKTIDLTIGMENGTSEMGTTTTDYSFQFAKRFWGNRISVIVGGKVSTGADATNSAESFIDNVSVEYRLDKSATRYVRAFYDRGTQDPFEGQLTKTGAGLVLRRKTNKLGELFIFRTRKKEPAAGQ